MIHRIHSSMLLASFALALAACGGGGGGGAPAKLSAAMLDSFQRSCQKAFDCKSSYVASMHGGQSFEEEYGGATVDACVNSLKSVLLAFNGPDYFTKLDDSVTAGRIKYTAKDYDTCVADGDSQTCDQVFEQNGAIDTLPAACDTYKVGQVATAGACTVDDDCATDGDGCDPDVHTCG